MKSYKDLEIYMESKRLAIEVHKMSLKLPKFELYEEGSQIRRSSKSVAAMIVEGYGRRRYKSRVYKIFNYSQSECDETMIHLDFLVETGSAIDCEEIDRLRNEYDILSKRINKFTKWVEEENQLPAASWLFLGPNKLASGNRQLATWSYLY
jgi:four helix bundle protein